ncbi:MAG: diphosphomevalonate decarboxylase [Legionella sp.]|nr:diphosphomevalonate decarboxylase [Legionella sp.]
MQWFAQAPSNIALIKYMGKEDAQSNIPSNPSLSYTLPKLLSNVALESTHWKEDFWEPLEVPGGENFTLSAKDQLRFLSHLNYLKGFFNYQGCFVVRSSNNFPLSSGLASSASSFAALTKAAVAALSELTKVEPPSLEVQSELSRVGSGSSCRSFYAPWALWEGENVKAIKLPYMNLIHQVVIISRAEKKISSREAHQRVKTSPLFKGRPERAIENLKLLLQAFDAKAWIDAYHICWQEFMDMHQLFTTSTPSFSYMTEQTEALLKAIETHWENHGDGPLVTMDAGPNVHLLYREDQQVMASQFTQDYLVGNHDFI